MARRTPWVAICALCLTRTVSAACEPWCTEPCTVLNGDVTRECDECDTGDGFLCHPGAVGYDNWRDRRTQQVAVSALGQSKDKADDPYVIERTHKSVVYKEWYHKIAEQHRDEVAPVNISDPTFDGWVYNQTDLDPRESPRTCGVHSCVLIDGDEPCAKAAGSADCDKPRGHLRPFGEQWESLERVETVYASEYAAQAFWEGAMSKYKPVLIKGGAAATSPLSEWTNEALRRKCAKHDGSPWWITLEKNNRISHNDRHPLLSGWDFCRFLNAYNKPENLNQLYCITSLNERGLPLLDSFQLPPVLACDGLRDRIHDVRMWMSNGNTTSSQHFDTHDNLLMQFGGHKEIYLSHPNESQYFYMDYHDKYGLAPINVDRIDLDRYPRFPQAKVLLASMEPGDALFIPDSWWHVIHSKRPDDVATDAGSGNIGVAFELEGFGNLALDWPAKLRALHGHLGMYWSEKRTIEGTLRERAYAEGRWDRWKFRCDAPLEDPLRNLSQYKFPKKHY